MFWKDKLIKMMDARITKEFGKKRLNKIISKTNKTNVRKILPKIIEEIYKLLSSEFILPSATFFVEVIVNPKSDKNTGKAEIDNPRA